RQNYTSIGMRGYRRMAIGVGERYFGLSRGLLAVALLTGAADMAYAQVTQAPGAQTEENEAEKKRNEDAANSGAPAPSSGIEMLDEISIYAERGPTLVLDVPATVTIINRKEIEDRMVRDIDDLVRYQPGISVE